MTTPQAAEYQEQTIMPLAREEGCKCPFDKQKYQAGDWRHQPGCPAPKVECLPNAARLTEALRII